MCVCVCVFEGCVLADDLFPSSLLVASLINSITIWKQLVLSGRMPSCMRQPGERQWCYTQEGQTQGGAMRVGRLVLGKIMDSAVEV